MILHINFIFLYKNKLRKARKVAIMNIKAFHILISILIFILLIPVGVTAFHYEKTITPYGDYCRHFSHYGRNKSMNSRAQAERALRHYYYKKGYDFEILSTEGRFLKVNLKNKGKVVDTIIFDRLTGRLRSIY